MRQSKNWLYLTTFRLCLYIENDKGSKLFFSWQFGSVVVRISVSRTHPVSSTYPEHVLNRPPQDSASGRFWFAIRRATRKGLPCRHSRRQPPGVCSGSRKVMSRIENEQGASSIRKPLTTCSLPRSASEKSDKSYSYVTQSSDKSSLTFT